MTSRGKIIVAMTIDGVIGLNNKIPWHYCADLQRFKRLTRHSTVIMGRKTWESLPIQPLPERQNIVITRAKLPDIECYPSLTQALANLQYDDVWFIGGAGVYSDAVNFSDLIDVTYVPDQIHDHNAVRFPAIDWSRWQAGPKIVHEDDHRLFRQQFQLKNARL